MSLGGRGGALQGFGGYGYQAPSVGPVPMAEPDPWQPLGTEAIRAQMAANMQTAADQQQQQQAGFNSKAMDMMLGASSPTATAMGPGIGVEAGLAAQGPTFAGMGGANFATGVPSAYAAAPNYFGATGGMANLGAGGTAGAAGGAGMGALGMAATIGLPVLAGAAMMNWENNTGTNTWGQQLRDPGGSALRRGEMHYDWLSDKGGKVGGYFGQPLRGVGRIASLRPREMWGGVRDLVSPITKIADLWS